MCVCVCVKMSDACVCVFVLSGLQYKECTMIRFGMLCYMFVFLICGLLFSSLRPSGSASFFSCCCFLNLVCSNATAVNVSLVLLHNLKFPNFFFFLSHPKLRGCYDINCLGLFEQHE